eukprot:TRINITY_DN12795_c1_g1_i1.p1 TRINITY_DN12795_c1_g1~~TRINITY_DN12795_c1_g1_i1.p1  ORF type:complete len:524 (-),score=60.49 TRINITY_DN12795_c1_g1_i1:223-1692(-)
MRTALAALKQSQTAFGTQIRGFAEVAVVGSSKYADLLPEAIPWAQSLSQFQETKITTLSNGLRVATEVVPHSENATIGMYIDAGSRFENDANNGVAHFLEHLIFKGTASRSRQDIEVEVENMGANLNAYTTRENTAYYARCLGKDIPRVCDLLGDILMNSQLSQSSVESERNVILREAQEIDGMPEEVMLDHLHATAFQHTPLGRTILGPTANIQSMSQEDVESYVRNHYTSGRMVLVASGQVDHDEVVACAEKTFSSLPKDSTTATDLVASDPSYFTGSMVEVRDPDMPQTLVAIAYPGARWLDADSVTLMVMQAMLGSWNKMSGAAHHKRSRLATYLAQNDLADSVVSFNTQYHNTGLFGIYASTTNAQHISDLCWVMMHEMTRMAYEVDENDLQLAKNAVKSQMLQHQSSSHGLCEDIGRQLLVYGRRIPREEFFARVDAVTTAMVIDVASRKMQDQDMAVSAVGELSFLPKYNWFRRRSYWNRYQ